MARLAPTLAALALVGAGLAACAGRSPPGAALDRYASALRAKNYDAAYALMSSEFRATTSRDEFVAMLRDNPREVADTADRLGSRKRRLAVSAELRYGLGDTLSLTEEDGHWRIATNPLAFYDQSTPRAALRSFLRAYRLERWDVMLRFVPRDYAELMNADKVKDQFTGERKDEMAQLMNQLEANIDDPIEEQGNEATLRYGSGYEVKFVREDGRWRLRDLD
ncbi:MAG TPA: hypothetical protein VHE35_04295 [Kofleriaceae bacterium]|nr:hypothetical protein [Kofleriaceae bacterium]